MTLSFIIITLIIIIIIYDNYGHLGEVNLSKSDINSTKNFDLQLLIVTLNDDLPLGDEESHEVGFDWLPLFRDADPVQSDLCPSFIQSDLHCCRFVWLAQFQLHQSWLCEDGVGISHGFSFDCDAQGFFLVAKWNLVG